LPACRLHLRLVMTPRHARLSPSQTRADDVTQARIHRVPRRIPPAPNEARGTAAVAEGAVGVARSGDAEEGAGAGGEGV